MTVRQFVELYYADELCERKGGLRSAEEEIKRLTTRSLGRELGAVKLSELSEWRIQKYIKKRRDAGIGPGGINRDLSRLSNLWVRARKRKLVSGDNPLREVGRLPEPRYQERFLAPEEEARLLPELPPDVRRLAEVALHHRHPARCAIRPPLAGPELAARTDHGSRHALKEPEVLHRPGESQSPRSPCRAPISRELHWARRPDLLQAERDASEVGQYRLGGSLQTSRDRGPPIPRPAPHRRESDCHGRGLAARGGGAPRPQHPLDDAALRPPLR